MTDKLYIRKIDETWVKLICDLSILQELDDEFQFEVSGAKFHPKVKARIWDGFIHLIKVSKAKTYLGLVPDIKKFCEVRGYEFICDYDFTQTLDPKELTETIRELKLPFKPHSHQLDGFFIALKRKHSIVLSPTASGKSLLIYMLIKQFLEWDKKRILLIVPTINLVKQMLGDFKEYAAELDDNVDDYVHLIYGGQDKTVKKPVTISTWQSLYKDDNTFFEQFDVVLCDEVHLAAAASISSIMEKSTKAEYKLGFTGSLNESTTNQMSLKSLFGEPYRVATTKELMDKGLISDMRINCFVLKYSADIVKAYKKVEYKDEIDFIVQHEPRNIFLKKLILSLEGNTLLLFRRIEKHGQLLYNMLKDELPADKLFFIHGGVDVDEREEVRRLTELGDGVVVLASMGVFQTGSSIKRLHNVILAQPTKSSIAVIQSIGRGLRLGHDKTMLNLYDVADQLSNSKGKKNHTYEHFAGRLAIYNQEGFVYKITEVPLVDL